MKNGREAIDVTATSEYDLILMDCHMPVMDGFATTKLLRDRERTSGSSAKRVPIIAVTAIVAQGDRERCLAAGRDAYAVSYNNLTRPARDRGENWGVAGVGCFVPPEPRPPPRQPLPAPRSRTAHYTQECDAAPGEAKSVGDKRGRRARQENEEPTRSRCRVPPLPTAPPIDQ